MSTPPMISPAAREVLKKVRMVVPPLLEKFHKGQLGRIAVIGGSKNYTGAPFFSANASAKLGADMSYVICEPAAASVIKTYSPNLMVSPLMRESKTPYPQDPSEPTADHVASTIVDLLARLHVLVIGPGLGRDELMQATCKKVITAARERQIPTVMDADALMIVNAEPSFVKGWKEVILTPNVVEFQRLAAAVGVDVGGVPREEACKHVSQALGGVCIIQKGDVDYISDGERTMTCDLQGGKKRSGGQGDTLTGSVGTFLCWRRAYLDKLWETEGNMGEDELVMLSAWGGAAITRECSRLAFAEKGRSLQASDVGDNVPRAFEALIGEREVGGEGARL